MRRTGGGGLFGFGFLIVDDEWLGGLVAGVVTPVGLHEHGIDLFEIDGFGLVAHGFDEGADAEVFHGPEGAFLLRAELMSYGFTTLRSGDFG